MHKSIFALVSTSLLLAGIFSTITTQAAPFITRSPTNSSGINRSSSNRYRPSQASSQAELFFLGCSGEQEGINEVKKVLKASIEAWNNHQIDDLLAFYAPYFKSRDGMSLDQIRTTLVDFWIEYPDARIDSNPTSLYVCGDYATVSLVEITTGSSKILDSKTLPYPGKFEANIRGLTTLKKIGHNWKIVSEDVNSENMLKYYGPVAEKFIKEGRVKLVINQPVKSKENYIAQLKYSLPERYHAIAFIDNILLGEFSDDQDGTDEDQKNKSNNADGKKIRDEKGKLTSEELNNISRNLEGADDLEGLRRLFKSNNYGQDEMVRAQIEIVSFENNAPSLAGVIGLSERVIPRPSSKQEPESARQIITETFKEESLNNIKKSRLKNITQEDD
ncbi:MAG: nuclear transport factor 2 family protein [Candidatus Caenarcaniphilales bacterium]|nr:nuclear transport factor 2 family protein [Candidatus Caenarcaniphilales bacterium]